MPGIRLLNRRMLPNTAVLARNAPAVGLAVWLALPAAALAQQPCSNPIALFESVKNGVQVTSASTQPVRRGAHRAPICEGDRIQVADNSRAVILILATNTPIAIDQNSEFIVTAAPARGGTLINLLRGALLYISRVRRAVEISTPFVNASIEGTEFVVRVDTDRTLITVFEGAVRATNQQGNVLVGAGQQAVAIQGQAPQLQVVVRPRDAVQWALYYEPILPSDSFAQLAAIPVGARDATFYIRRASFLLGAGQLDEARADLDQAQSLDPSNGNAHALRAIVAVALNDKQGALDSGRMAVERSPQSASAQLALSYALQSNFELEAARDAVAQAVEAQPNDAAALARLAELRLMLDDVGGAGDAARQAVTLSPQLSRAQTVLGFTLLGQLNPSGAREAFQRAIDIESDNPWARLGLGLSRIRQGDLSEGRGDLELAVALNPESSLFRSYLGKAYYEEKREPLPAEQFDMAKQLDSRDPTPLLYDAIRKQTLNRPVEALQDLEKAINLNDNRAVYRSRLLLDQDLAARSASLGRLYRDLGFDQLAPVEGWKSLDAAPGDFSGHRLLADTYFALPRHEVARVSELLQAQLLQPISITPVPPHLAETDLFILERSGPDELGFNEFNPLFNRNRFALQASGVFGNKSVFGDEVTVSAVWNRLSFSVGQFHYDTNGFRENNQQDRDIANAFLQVQLSPATSVQAEFRSEATSKGDLNLLFDPLNFSSDQTVQQNSTVTRVGLRHVFSPRSLVIGSFYLGQQDDRSTSSANAPALGITGQLSSLSNTDSWTFELRHLFTAGRLTLTSGFGHFQSDRERDETAELQLPFPPFSVNTAEHFSDDPKQTNAYVYSLMSLPQRVTFTLGASADFYERSTFERKQFNPKAGITWNPIPSTTVRVAAFRTLHRALVSSQTIEPTQVSGFNQFFSDNEGEEAFRYGLALDHKISSRLFGGLEYSWRNLKVPVEFVKESGIVVERFDRKEQLGRSYFYWSPQDNLALSVEYVFERFDRTGGSEGAEGILNLRTHRVPLGIRYFSAWGWFAGLRATHINQTGSFADVRFSASGEDQFWVVDTAVGYRLPKRYGRLSFEIKNLLDKEFRFQDTDPGNPVVKPSRSALITFTVSL